MKNNKKDLELKKPLFGGQSRRSLVSVLIIILVVVSALFLVKPKVSEILEARKAIKKEREKLAQLTQKEALLASLNEVELIQRANLTLAVLPVEKEVPLVLSSLKVLTIESGLTLGPIGVNPGKISTGSAEISPPKAEVLPSYAFSLQAQGNTDQIKTFIEKVEQITPLLQVKSLSVSQEETDLASVDLVISAFFLSLPEKVGPVDQPLLLLTQAEEEMLKKISSYQSVLTGEALPFVPTGKANPFAF